jgi:hypothetical protein
VAVSITRRRSHRGCAGGAPQAPIEAISNSRLWWNSSPRSGHLDCDPDPDVTVQLADLQADGAEPVHADRVPSAISASGATSVTSATIS